MCITIFRSYTETTERSPFVAEDKDDARAASFSAHFHTLWPTSSSARLADVACHIIITTSVHAKRMAAMKRKRKILKGMWRGLIPGTSFLGFGIEQTPWNRFLFEKLLFD